LQADNSQQEEIMDATTRKTYQPPVIQCQGNAVEKTRINDLPPEESMDVERFTKAGSVGFGL
jgi:hypothetical protein